MPTITLEPLKVPPELIIRSMAKSLAAGLVACALLYFGTGWPLLVAVPLLVYAFIGLFWYPLAERRLSSETLVLDGQGLRWRKHFLPYADVATLVYRRKGPHDRQLRLKNCQSGGHAFSLHHYRLPEGMNDQQLVDLLSKRILRANPSAKVELQDD